jgi:Kdo2-lipid IVA lauroyltransferase/acyltransferase
MHTTRRLFYYLTAQLNITLLRLLSCLPYPIAARLGEMLGALLFIFPSRRKHIVFANLRACFPSWAEEKHRATARRVFRYVARSFVERGMLWCGSAKRLRKWVSVEGTENLAQLQGVPHIFLTMHMVGIEAGALRLACHHADLGWKLGAMPYVPARNPYFDAFIKKARERFCGSIRPRDGQAGYLARCIRRGGGPPILSPDMDFGLKNSEFIDFFGIPACTLTSLPRLARLTGAKIVPTSTEVLPGYLGYRLRIHPSWEDYAGVDLHQATRRMNAFFEDCIAVDPAQYYWVHRRFKTRPAGHSKMY